MKKILFLIAFATSSFILNAQDVLVHKSGEVENVKVLEVSPTKVKYKKSNNPDGPTYIEKRSNLYSIKYQNGEVQTFKEGDNQNDIYHYYAKYGKEKKFIHEADLFIGTGWGLGYQLRREFNPYVGWNIVGLSYMSDYTYLGDYCINLKLLGVRGNTPAYKYFRGYGELNFSYSYCDGSDVGMELGLGIQVHKHIAFGYDLTCLFGEDSGIHMIKLSYIF